MKETGNLRGSCGRCVTTRCAPWWRRWAAFRAGTTCGPGPRPGGRSPPAAGNVSRASAAVRTPAGVPVARTAPAAAPSAPDSAAAVDRPCSPLKSKIVPFHFELNRLLGCVVSLIQFHTRGTHLDDFLFDYLVDFLVNYLDTYLNWLLSWLLKRLHSWLISWLVRRLLSWLLRRLFSWLLRRLSSLLR